MPSELHDITSSTAESLSTIILWCTYLLPFAGVVLLLVLLWKRRYVWSVVVLLLISAFCYVRFIEKEMLIVRNEFFTFSGSGEILSEVKIAVFSDPHIGVYTSSAFLQKVVDTVKTQNPDVVLIPGDFIYGMHLQDLDTAFAPLAQLSVPVYAVAGNHDSEAPGSIPSATVREKVGAWGVRFVDNAKATITVQGKELTILGLSDLWEGAMDEASLQEITEDQNTVLIAHNPDTVYAINSYPVDLVVSGHTHGGQMKIPFLYQHMIPSEFGFERGWYDREGYRIYVTSGVGEVGLPMRLAVPPEVVMITARVY